MIQCLGKAKRIPKVSYREVKARGKRFVQGICYFINIIPKFIFLKNKRSKRKTILIELRVKLIDIF